jgi:hypothetical protein
MALQSAADFYDAQQRRILLTLNATRGEWSKLSKPSDFDQILKRIYALIVTAQLGAAKDAATYVPAALEEQGAPSKTPLRVAPAAFAGWGYSTTNPGLARPLNSLLGIVPSMATGSDLATQMAAGGTFLDLLAKTQIIEAGRMATSTGISIRPSAGWVRQVRPPCCQNCAVLAGKWFRRNTGFQRHHGCDCIHVPAHGRDVPEGYTDTIAPDQIHDLTEAQQQAIAAGADMNQVINAYRDATPSMRAQMFTTGEGSTRRGYASYIRRAIDQQQGITTAETATAVGKRGAVKNYTVRRLAQRRLTPEGIYTIARNDREVLTLLRANGYVVGDIRQIAEQVAALTP